MQILYPNRQIDTPLPTYSNKIRKNTYVAVFRPKTQLLPPAQPIFTNPFAINPQPARRYMYKYRTIPHRYNSAAAQAAR
jgi:hypothetical protein